MHTSRCSGLSGMKATVFTDSSLSPASLGSRNWEMHLELRTSHTRTVPSLEAETTREPSGEKCTSLTYLVRVRVRVRVGVGVSVRVGCRVSVSVRVGG